MKGATIKRVHLRRKDLRRPFPRGLARALEGRRVVDVARRAKYLLVGVEGGAVLIWHLGMSGAVRIFKPGEAMPRAGKHDHVQFDLSSGAHIVFTDPRRFGLMDLCADGKLDAHPLLKDIGPEPLEAAFDAGVLRAQLKGRRGPIKPALLVPKVVAGVGNIYASEALYRAGISPRRGCGSIGPGRAGRLVDAIKAVLKAAIKAGGSTLKDHRTPDGGLGYFQFAFAVYGREAEACPDCDCDVAKTGGIQKLVQGGRATFYCPRRQR